MIRQRVIGAFLAILILFALNLSIYLWSNQKRSASMESLRHSISRQDIIASIKQNLNDLQKQVALLSQVTVEAGSGGASPAEVDQFKGQLQAIEKENQRLLDLSGPDARAQVESFQKTYRELSASWLIFYGNFGIHHARAITELATRSESLSRRVMQQLEQLQEDEKHRVEGAGANFYQVSRFTTRITIVIFAISILLAVGLAYAVSRYLARIFGEETQLLAVTTALSSELNLYPLLVKIMDTTTAILDADRSTLFLYDEKSNELWSRVAQGMEVQEIRFPSHLGIAGTVFTTRETINIPNAYTDPRFNPEVDKKTGYHTHSILCMPVINKQEQTIGVTQVLNKKGGPFTDKDEQRLRAFSAQASIAIENAKLFDDVLNMKNYNESILHSLSNGVVTLNAENQVVKCNDAASRILNIAKDQIEGHPADEFFSGENKWVLHTIAHVQETQVADFSMDTELLLSNENRISVNMTVVPLISIKKQPIGSMLVFEDITKEKRIKGTMARYMTKEVADKLLEGGETALGGQRHVASVLFSDIRNFTTIAEKMGSPEEVVSMLNEYFTIMVDVIFSYNGILDKYIGDAIMAVFGAPFSSIQDADHAVQTAVDMMRALTEFNNKRTGERKDPINIGIGINTGDLLSGNIGSLKRMDYTVIGDGVNLASRLEGINKHYGTNILISEFTFRQLNNSYRCREAGLIKVKGKDKPVGVYEVLDHHDRVSFPHMDEVLTIYGEGMGHYRQKEWTQAIEKFKSALVLNTHDHLSRVYVKRCEYFLHHPPEEPWDGAWVMESK